MHLQLSPECQDLLDKIFQVDPKQRITLQEIQKHPWYTATLSSSYQGSWDQLEQEQQRVDNHIHSRQLDMVRVCLPWGVQGTFGCWVERLHPQPRVRSCLLLLVASSCCSSPVRWTLGEAGHGGPEGSACHSKARGVVQCTPSHGLCQIHVA